MALPEELDVFFADMGIDCSIGGGSTFKGLLEAPAEVIAGGMAISREYVLRTKTSNVSSAVRGTTITVDGDDYTVREKIATDDGLISDLLLSKD